MGIFTVLKIIVSTALFFFFILTANNCYIFFFKIYIKILQISTYTIPYKYLNLYVKYLIKLSIFWSVNSIPLDTQHGHFPILTNDLIRYKLINYKGVCLFDIEEEKREFHIREEKIFIFISLLIVKVFFILA